VTGVFLLSILSCAKTAPEVPMAEAADVFEVACAVARGSEDLSSVRTEVESRGWRWIGHGDTYVSLGSPSPVRGAALDEAFGARKAVPGVDGLGLGSWSRWSIPGGDCRVRAQLGDGDQTERLTVERPKT
jgi:hypothetical protein